MLWRHGNFCDIGKWYERFGPSWNCGTSLPGIFRANTLTTPDIRQNYPLWTLHTYLNTTHCAYLSTARLSIQAAWSRLVRFAALFDHAYLNTTHCAYLNTACWSIQAAWSKLVRFVALFAQGFLNSWKKSRLAQNNCKLISFFFRQKKTKQNKCKNIKQNLWYNLCVFVIFDSLFCWNIKIVLQGQ